MRQAQVKIHLINCPLCSSSSHLPLYHDLSDVEDCIPGKYTISRCRSCGLVYLSTRPTENTLPNCYPKDYHVRVESQKSEFTQFLYSFKYTSAVSQLEQIIGKIPVSLIDIGCGSGRLLLALRNKWGSQCRLAGIDLAHPATNELEESGIKLYIGSVEKLRPSRQFQVVIMYEILEHVYNPVIALRSAGRWLKKDGILIGEVPHFHSPWRKIFPRHWQGFQIPRHMTFFDEASIEKVLDKAGYTLIKTENHYIPGDFGVSLCNVFATSFFPGQRSRQLPIFIPCMLLTEPVTLLSYWLFNIPTILSFVAKKKN